MSRNHNAVKIAELTGQGYRNALVELRRRSGLGQGRWYLIAVDSLTPLAEGAKRCVRCLAPAHGRCDR